MGKETLFVPRRPRLTILYLPTLEGSTVRLGGDVLRQRWARGGGAVDPFGVGVDLTPRSVGGGHPNRALAHGYSRLTPSGFKHRLGPDFRTLRVQPKMWDMLS